MLVTPSCMYLKSEMFGETVINMFNGDADKYMLVHINPAWGYSRRMVRNQSTDESSLVRYETVDD